MKYLAFGYLPNSDNLTPFGLYETEEEAREAIKKNKEEFGFVECEIWIATTNKEDLKNG